MGNELEMQVHKFALPLPPNIKKCLDIEHHNQTDTSCCRKMILWCKQKQCCPQKIVFLYFLCVALVPFLAILSLILSLSLSLLPPFLSVYLSFPSLRFSLFTLCRFGPFPFNLIINLISLSFFCSSFSIHIYLSLLHPSTPFAQGGLTASLLCKHCAIQTGFQIRNENSIQTLFQFVGDSRAKKFVCENRLGMMIVRYVHICMVRYRLVNYAQEFIFRIKFSRICEKLAFTAPSILTINQ